MDSPPLTRALLVERFHGWAQPPSSWRVGGEFERHALRPDGTPVGYDGPHGIRALLEALAADTGWALQEEDRRPIGLQAPDGGPRVSLEPGGQLELSGRPHARLADLATEFHDFLGSLRRLTREWPLCWVACGYHPFATVEAIGWVPKSRYDVMRAYLAGRGELAHAMMKATCSVQVNVDYGDEDDCARKVQVVARLAPLTTALLANSPLKEGRPTGFLSYRAHVWAHVDGQRCGLPPALVDGYRHARWVDHLLQVPMMFVRQQGRHVPARGMTFARWMEAGFLGRRPTLEDWDLHLTSVFPEARVKRTLEIRGMDCVPQALATAASALFAGLLYDSAALDGALGLAKDLTRWGTPEELWGRAARAGLQAEAGRSYSAWASDMVALAHRGLAAWQPTALPLLAPLEALAARGSSPAVDLLATHRRDPRPAAILATLDT
jgi:glutamate--cysteine ligase